MSKPAPYATKIAIPLPPEEVVKKAMGESYKPETLDVTKLLTGTRDCFGPIVALFKALFQAGDSDAKLTEVVTLRAAALLKAPYVAAELQDGAERGPEFCPARLSSRGHAKPTRWNVTTVA